ncbi:MAG TPA: DUF433 domain-containing protein [Verrucomicrobiae bacterium]|jgi:uncharacterized protein (DUF433 family)|nr:DUF433 domain-containing protein [Verrucomicrobiae bacterium]
MLDWNNCSAVEHAGGKEGGVWVFKNTSVPVRVLFENLEGGATVNDFLTWFPAVVRSQVEVVLEFTEASLATSWTIDAGTDKK